MKRLGFNWSNYCFSKALFLVLIVLNLFACSSEDSATSENGNGDSGDFAPESVSKKQFTFYKEDSDMWSFKAYFGEEPSIITSSSYFTVKDCDAYYTKNGANTASFECYYVAYTYMGGDEIGVWAKYNLQLTFLSAHHGKYAGKLCNNPYNTNEETVSGMFVYDSDKGLDYFVEKEENKGNDEEGEENGKDNNEEEQKGFSISSPIIEDISTNGATVKGTIIGEDVKFQDRGICYSTNKSPTINDSKISQNTNVINKSLSKLFAGTTYYVRLYAKVNDKYYYGEESAFTTNGERVTKLILKEVCETSNLIKSRLEVSAILPNEIGYYGLCYGKNPQPKITDNFTEETNRKTNWVLSNIECGSEYYVRAYHIEGTEVIYYDDSETKFVPLKNKQIQYQFDYSIGGFNGGSSYTLSITFNDLPKGIYEIKPVVWRYKDGYYTMYGKNYDRPIKYLEITERTMTVEFSGSIDFPNQGSSSSHLNNNRFYLDGFTIKPVDNDDVKAYNITFIDGDLNKASK